MLEEVGSEWILMEMKEGWMELFREWNRKEGNKIGMDWKVEREGLDS